MGFLAGSGGSIANIAIILLSIVLSSVAHTLLKKGVLVMPPIADGGITLSSLVNVAFNGWLLGGALLHVGALIVWVFALSRVELSYAYPFLALGYILVSVMSFLWLGEVFGSQRLMGMLVIMVGVIIIAKS